MLLMAFSNGISPYVPKLCRPTDNSFFFHLIQSALAAAPDVNTQSKTFSFGQKILASIGNRLDRLNGVARQSIVTVLAQEWNLEMDLLQHLDLCRGSERENWKLHMPSQCKSCRTPISSLPSALATSVLVPSDLPEQPPCQSLSTWRIPNRCFWSSFGNMRHQSTAATSTSTYGNTTGNHLHFSMRTSYFCHLIESSYHSKLPKCYRASPLSVSGTRSSVQIQTATTRGLRPVRSFCPS